MRINNKTFFGLIFSAIILFGCRNGNDSEQLCTRIESVFLQTDIEKTNWVGGAAEILKNKFYGLEKFPYEKFLLEIDSLSRSKLIVEFIRLKDTLSAVQKVKFLKDIIFSIRSVSFDSSSLDIYNLFPHTVWKNRRGSCLGTSLLMLIVAEKMELPVYPVLLPGHLFLRYVDGDTSINMEPNRRGYTYSDSAYRVKYNVEPGSRYNLQPVKDAELKAVWLYSLGSIYMNKKAYSRAACLYKLSLSLMPNYAEAMGNLGLSYFYLGQDSLALNILIDSKHHLHDDINIYKNLASIYSHRRQYSDAVKEYREGLVNHPENTDILLGISKAYMNLDSLNQAEIYLVRLLEVKPNLQEARQMLNTLRK